MGPTDDRQELTMPVPFVDSTAILADGEALRERAATDSYLFFRGLLPAEDILEVRADVLGVVGRHGWLRPDQPPLGGLLNRDAFAAIPESAMRTDIGVTRAMYDDVQKLERMHRLPHHPALVALIERILA